MLNIKFLNVVFNRLGYIFISDLVKNYKKYIVIDIRSRKDFFESHIVLGRGFVGVNIPYFEFKSKLKTKKNLSIFKRKILTKNIVISCNNMKRAKYVKKIVQKELKNKKIFILYGGYLAYKKHMFDLDF